MLYVIKDTSKARKKMRYGRVVLCVRVCFSSQRALPTTSFPRISLLQTHPPTYTHTHTHTYIYMYTNSTTHRGAVGEMRSDAAVSELSSTVHRCPCHVRLRANRFLSVCVEVCACTNKRRLVLLCVSVCSFFCVITLSSYILSSTPPLVSLKVFVHWNCRTPLSFPPTYTGAEMLSTHYALPFVSLLRRMLMLSVACTCMCVCVSAYVCVYM